MEGALREALDLALQAKIVEREMRGQLAIFRCALPCMGSAVCHGRPEVIIHKRSAVEECPYRFTAAAFANIRGPVRMGPHERRVLDRRRPNERPFIRLEVSEGGRIKEHL